MSSISLIHTNSETSPVDDDFLMKMDCAEREKYH